MTTRARIRVLLGIVVTLALVGSLGWLWWGSRLPTTYSVSAMGEMEYGGGPAMSHARRGTAGSEGQVSVRDLDTPKDLPADVVVHLSAHQGTVRLASGQKVAGYTLNGTSPGPLIEATVGQLVEVHLHNDNVAAGIALHWHGVDVPNAEDGVAGITQDAIMPGHDHTYRWVAPASGTYWYHSHQVSHEQVSGGLLGPILIHPRSPEPQVRDVVALAHLYGGDEAMNGHLGLQRVEAPAGQRVRVRLVNTDNGPARAWVGAAYTLVAIDGHDVNRPTQVTGKGMVVPAGGRADLELTVPDGGRAVRVQLGDAAMAIGPSGASAPAVAEPEGDVDLLRYGSPAPIPYDATTPDRRFRYSIGRRAGFLNGRPGLWWSVNGHLPPHLPMFVVRRGDVVQVTISNHSGDVHPMHLHGHHAVVVSRDGKPVTGSPWWFDSLDVQDGSTYVVAFLADNPGIWMDHCHNLEHAAQGLVTHLMYEGVTTPYELGDDSGNEPE